MNTKIVITFNWWPTEDRKGKVKKKHQEALNESAQERIFAMMKEGYSSGELHDNVRMDDEDGPDGVSYQGWWDTTIKTK